MIRREVMVLPINGDRDDAVRVFSLEDEAGVAEYGYEVRISPRDRAAGTGHGVRVFPTECEAFDWAFQNAAWNASVTPRYTD